MSVELLTIIAFASLGVVGIILGLAKLYGGAQRRSGRSSAEAESLAEGAERIARGARRRSENPDSGPSLSERWKRLRERANK